MTARPKIGVSSCLLGELVRYDGRTKYTEWVGALATEFELVSFCPEVAIGLGVPRPAIELVAINGGVQVLGVVDPTVDVTTPLANEAQDARWGSLDGYVFKARSPSCGVHTVPIKGGGLGRGGFASALMARYPNLPIIEDDIAPERTRFLARVHAHFSARYGQGPTLRFKLPS